MNLVRFLIIKNTFCCFIQLPAVCQTSNRKLHFSIYGKKGDAKVSDGVSIYNISLFVSVAFILTVIWIYTPSLQANKVIVTLVTQHQIS